MHEAQTISALGALAHAQRLRTFRALVIAGPIGLTPSTLADQLQIARNAMSFHLKELAHADLVSVEQRGRHLIYRANFGQMDKLIGYLTEHCCQGSDCSPAPASSTPRVTDVSTTLHTPSSLTSPVSPTSCCKPDS
ncbi:ArsR/SmtB family transcription factor [Orrella marina]|uniref:Transcriptional regulator n=1 Tax=Orrella marina TaxID=2163011 RepID=A0A2R4XG46_9BURK|nr:transcriptional regulator [Orrella marina]